MAYILLIVRIIMVALMALSGIVVVVAVTLQKSDSDGLSALTNSGSKNDSFYGKNKAKNKEGLLKRITMIFSIALAVCSIVFFILGQVT